MGKVSEWNFALVSSLIIANQVRSSSSAVTRLGRQISGKEPYLQFRASTSLAGPAAVASLRLAD